MIGSLDLTYLGSGSVKRVKPVEIWYTVEYQAVNMTHANIKLL